MPGIIKFKHIYECYPLYQALYGVNNYHKSYDSLTAAVALENWVQETKAKKINILEAFSGKSEHKDSFIQQFGYADLVSSYNCLDKYAVSQQSASVIAGDALTFDYSKFNVVLAFYYSLNSTFIQGVEFPRKVLDAFFLNLYSTLKPKSAVFLHLGAVDFRFALEQVSEPDVHDITLRPNCELLKYFHIFDKPAVLKYRVSNYYDRLTRCNYAKYTKICIVCDDEDQITIAISSPFIHRFWSESEVIDSMRSAGFSKFRFYHNTMSHDDLPCDELNTIVKYPECPSAASNVKEAINNMTTTDLLAIT